MLMSAISTDAEGERRRHARRPASGEIVGRELALLGAPETTGKTIRGQIEDLSESGVRLQTSYPLKNGALLLCELPFVRARIGVPTLMKVQWTTKIDVTGRRYRSGLLSVV
jgi:hypothetical protein